MKIFTHNATALLFEKANSLRHIHDSWRCIQLKLSDTRHYSPTLRRHFVLRGITELLDEHDGYVYLCDDNDIMILFQGRAQGIMNKLASYFADVDSKELFTLYDLHKDWAFFFALCYKKSMHRDDDWYPGTLSARLESKFIPAS